MSTDASLTRVQFEAIWFHEVEQAVRGSRAAVAVVVLHPRMAAHFTARDTVGLRESCLHVHVLIDPSAETSARIFKHVGTLIE